MSYVLAFLEGIISFISPCILPMLPLYIGYLAGGVSPEEGNNKLLGNSLSFILGFTLVFVALGAAASSLGMFLQKQLPILNRIGGIIVILLGLNYIGVVAIPFINRERRMEMKQTQAMGPLRSILFGMVFALGWTPCVGPFLGSALMMAANTAHVFQGIVTLICYALGIALPFFLVAILFGSLQGTFTFIKKHYKIITMIGGILLLAMGIALVAGFNPAVLFG